LSLKGALVAAVNAGRWTMTGTNTGTFDLLGLLMALTAHPLAG